MAAPGFAFLLFCLAMTRTLGSELEPSSSSRILDSITAPNQKDVESSTSLTIQAEREQLLVYISHTMANISEALRKEFQTLLSNHSLRVEQSLRNQSLLIVKLGQQLEDVQSVLPCTGEPPSPQNGRLMDFERKHGSVVLYRCDGNFVLTENSTVRCHLGKWEGCPPLCTRPSTSALSLRAHLAKYGWSTVSNVTCSDEENGQQVHFSRFLDTGTGGALPTAARTYTRGRVAVLDLSGVREEDKRGVFQCGHGDGTGIAFAITRFGFFLWPRVASVGDNVTLGHEVLFHDPSYRWLHDGQHLPAWDGRVWVEIDGVGKEDAGFYELYEEGRRQVIHYFFRLVVRGYPVGFFGQSCEVNRSACYNGGVFHKELGTCVCPVGFRGQLCEEACGRDRVGPDCSEACDGGDCRSQIFCQPDPPACSCAPGYRGYSCDHRCWPGSFGVDCKQTCRCNEGSCDRYTGACSGGCSEGWTGSSCQIPDGW